jgi:ABC-type uncharacterized transport system involved in gliding motility auxiliary subunit
VEKLMNRYLQKLDTLGLILLVAAALYYSVTNLMDRWALGLLIAGAAFVILGLAANYRQIVSTLGKRSTKYATNYVVSVVLVAGLVSAVNYMGQRHPKRFDLTASGKYSLAPQTLQVVRKLNQDVQVKAFFSGGEYPPLRDLLMGYRTQNPRLHYEFIDPDKHPDIAKQYEVTVYGNFQNPFTGSQMKSGTVIVMMGDRKEKIEKRSEEVREEDLTNSIIKVQRKEAKKVVFAEGHSEKDPDDTERTGYSSAKKALEAEGYQVEKVNLASAGKVPPDAKVLAIAGPTAEPFPQELQYVNDFLNQGGGVMILVDPQAPALGSFLKGWGIIADNDIVLDVSGAGRLMGAGPTIPLVMKYETHKITDRFRAMTFFSMTRSIRPAPDKVEGVNVEILFKSNENSWGETNLKSQEASFDEKTDLKGPLSLAVAATKEVRAATDAAPGAKARLVVVGDSDFPMNAYFEAQGNGNLFLNMISWLAQEEDLISIRPKPPEDRRVIMSQSQQALLRLVAVFFIPGIVLIAGIVVWTRRRR